jgi:hypothetical protein
MFRRLFACEQPSANLLRHGDAHGAHPEVDLAQKEGQPDHESEHRR